MKRSARLTVRVHPQGLQYLRGLALAHGRTVADEVRVALADHAESSLARIGVSMLIAGYSVGQRRRHAAAILAGGPLPRLRKPKGKK